MKKHFYIEYNKYGMISYNSFGGPGKNGYVFLQFATLEKLNAFLEEHEFIGCNLVARRCKYADADSGASHPSAAAGAGGGDPARPWRPIPPRLAALVVAIPARPWRPFPRGALALGKIRHSVPPSPSATAGVAVC